MRSSFHALRTLGLLALAGCTAAPPARNLDEGHDCEPPQAFPVEPPAPELERVVEGAPRPHLLDAQLTVAGYPITHALPTEQLLDAPVPFYIEVPPLVEVASAKLFYRGFGTTRWSRLVMHRMGDAFGALLPCHDTRVIGQLRYFIVLYNEDGDRIEALGARDAPLALTIKNQLDGGPPALPGQRPPTRCRAGE